MKKQLREDAIIELQKVFRLAVNGHRIHVFSPLIDSVWHSLLHDREAYIDFSVRSCGAVIVHREDEGVGSINFVKAYEDAFGVFPEIWFMNEKEDFDLESYDYYHKYGEIRASWKCSATHNCLREIVRRKIKKPNEEPIDGIGANQDSPPAEKEKQDESPAADQN